MQKIRKPSKRQEKHLGVLKMKLNPKNIEQDYKNATSDDINANNWSETLLVKSTKF